ncbi:MAG: ion transporter [Blautia sp.]|nr:ion transporter [Blautia sp.]
MEIRKRRIFDIIQIGNRSDRESRAFDIFIVINILANILVLFLQTFDSLCAYFPLFDAIEACTVAVFIVEYALRIWTAEFLFPGRGKRYAVKHFLLSFDGIVDLLTILPFFFLSGFVAFRMLRVVRIFHLFRINATYDSFNVIWSVLYEKRNQLASSLFIIIVMMLASSLFLYSAEHQAQPEIFQNAFSGIWWSVNTLLTVGYGDIYPVTAVGRAMAILIAFLGVGMVAIPTGIISAGFVEQYTQMQNKDGSQDISLGLQTVVIDIDSSWIGKSVDEIRQEYRAEPVLISRDGVSFSPAGEERVHLGDALAVHIL